MRNLLIRSLVACACLLTLSFGVKAQAKKNAVARQESSTASTIFNEAGKAGVIVVASATKIAWGTTKFVAKDLAVPVGKGLLKPMIVKAAPAMAKFAIKKSAKYLLPLAVKLSIL